MQPGIDVCFRTPTSDGTGIGVTLGGALDHLICCRALHGQYLPRSSLEECWLRREGTLMVRAAGKLDGDGDGGGAADDDCDADGDDYRTSAMSML